MDSPIVGHGSWAQDIHYVILNLARQQQQGVHVNIDLSNPLIPTHSHLTGAWVEGGIFGGLFWIWALWITLKGLYAVLKRPTPLTGFISFVAISLLWDIFFSPFGLDLRFVTAAHLYLMMLVAEPLQKSTVLRRCA